MKAFLPLFSFLFLGIAGCAKPEEDLPGIVAAPKVETIAFEGSTDPAFAGTWISIDKKSTMVLGADGAAQMKSDVATHGKAFNGAVSGKWKSSKDSLLFQQDGGAVTRFYTTSKGKDTMEVRRVKGSAIVIVYKRQA